MSELPATIHSPGTFLASQPPGFDGAVHWEWIQRCWTNPKDRPQDIDLFKERHGQILIMETKAPGAPIPAGQLVGLRALWMLRNVTVVLCWGKETPLYGRVWWPKCLNCRPPVRQWEGVDELIRIVSRWETWARSQPAPKGLWHGIGGRGRG